MQEMMTSFNNMSMQTGGNGVNPLIQAQMMNELKYRRLYEEERARNENLERKMASLIDRIERHTENNMKIKAKYSKEIEHLRYQVNILERENEDFRVNQNQNGEDLQMQLNQISTQKQDLEQRVQMLQNELEMARVELNSQVQNPEKERELQSQIESMRMEMQRYQEDLKIAKEMVEEERQKGGRERSQLEIERHKMGLDVEHWKGQTDQMDRELNALRDILQYEKGAKMRLEERVRELESRSFRGGNGGKVVVYKVIEKIGMEEGSRIKGGGISRIEAEDIMIIEIIGHRTPEMGNMMHTETQITGTNSPGKTRIEISLINSQIDQKISKKKKISCLGNPLFLPNEVLVPIWGGKEVIVRLLSMRNWIYMGIKMIMGSEVM